jgi:hypothetical protein
MLGTTAGADGAHGRQTAPGGGLGGFVGGGLGGLDKLLRTAALPQAGEHYVF